MAAFFVAQIVALCYDTHMGNSPTRRPYERREEDHSVDGDHECAGSLAQAGHEPDLTDILDSILKAAKAVKDDGGQSHTIIFHVNMNGDHFTLAHADYPGIGKFIEKLLGKMPKEVRAMMLLKLTQELL